MSEQLALDMPAQRRRVTPEPVELWHAVLLLRRFGGCTVHRAGDAGAMVDGVVRSNAWVMSKARAIRRKAPFGPNA